MTTFGPPVAELVYRLSSCPADFLAPPVVGDGGTVAVAAVVGDVLRRLDSASDGDGDMPPEWIAALAPATADATTGNWLRACLVTCWLAADPALSGLLTGPGLLRFMGDDLHRMVGVVRPEMLVRDPDRREELARLLLHSARLVPAGESADHAADRLQTLDSVTRLRVEGEARAAEERARAVREALESRRAAEAAARASRE